MSDETTSKPELPSAKDRRKINAEAELDKINGSHPLANGEEPKTARVESVPNNESKASDVDTDPKPLEPLGSVFAATDSKDSAGDGVSQAGKASDAKKSPFVEKAQQSNGHDGEGEKDAGGSESSAARGDISSERAEPSETDGKSLEDDFEEVGVDDGSSLGGKSASYKEETNKQLENGRTSRENSDNLGSFDRAGVNKSIPVRLHEQLARKSMSSELSDSLPDSRSTVPVQRSSSNQKSVPSVDLPDDKGPFTEESLQSADRGAADARPMSPAPVAPPTFPEASTPTAVEPEEYRGLVFYDGVDSMGRPVVIINADALPRAASRKAAVNYLLQRLEPIVIQGPYVAIFLNLGETSKQNRLPAGWLASCYRQMSYPFKKNVKHVILVRPSFALNFMLGLLSPLISRKAHAKIKKVENLTALEAATNSEVTLQHLGPRFNTIAAQSIIKGEGPTYGQGAAYQMPNL